MMTLLVVAVLSLSPVLAFVQPQQQPRISCSRLFSLENHEDVESARRQLEVLMKDQVVAEVDKEERPLLSSIGRERREAEIKMLNSLRYSDDATAALWALWYGERGPQASREIHAIEALFADPNNWEDAEERLEDLVEEHGLLFLEPINRLATLYYLQGKFEQSKKMCEHVLEHKPWHIGALSGIVLVCANMNLLTEARHWADQRLPPIPPDGTSSSERREEWVLRAVDDAETALEQEEERVLKAFGKKQEYETPPPVEEVVEDQDEEGAWQ